MVSQQRAQALTGPVLGLLVQPASIGKSALQFTKCFFSSKENGGNVSLCIPSKLEASRFAQNDVTRYAGLREMCQM